MAQSSILKRFGLTALAAIIVARFSRLLNSPCHLTNPDGTQRDRKWIGNYGERVAADWLRAHRCKILARNFTGPRRGEVDLIARDGKLLLFVEVKTRRRLTMDDLSRAEQLDRLPPPVSYPDTNRSLPNGWWDTS